MEAFGALRLVPGKSQPRDRDNLVWRGIAFLDGVSLKQLLAKYQMPLAVTNDGKAAALAEWWLETLKGFKTELP